MIYDDGSTIDSDNFGTIYATDTTGNTVSSVTTDDAYWAADNRESNKLSQFYPNNGATWYENLAKYGATRAIDAHFATPPVNKTATGATYAGANGKTYAGNNQPRTLDSGNNEGIMFLLLAGAAFFALS